MTMVDKLFEKEINGKIISSFDIKKIYNSGKINNVATCLAEATAI